MTDLDTMLRDALTTDAERAPSIPPEWAGPATATIVPIATHRPGRRIAVAAAGIAAAAAAVVVLALVTRPDDPTVRVPATEPIPTPWQPPGTEFPLTDLGPATESQGWAGRGSAHPAGRGRRDHPDRIVAPSLTYHARPDRRVGVLRWSAPAAVAADRSGTRDCRSASLRRIDNRRRRSTCSRSKDVPAGAAFVGYSDGETEYWQRPVVRVRRVPERAGNGRGRRPLGRRRRR